MNETKGFEHWTLSFDDGIDPLSEKTIVSGRIPFPFEIIEMKFEFRKGCETLLEYKVFASDNNIAPSSGEPPGINVLSGYGQRDYIAAEDAIISIYHTFRVEHPGWYVKLYVNNRDIFEHTVGAWITLRILSKGVIA